MRLRPLKFRLRHDRALRAGGVLRAVVGLPPGMLPGALIQIRTGDLVLTKNALCQLSYEGPNRPGPTLDRNLTAATAREWLSPLLPRRATMPAGGEVAARRASWVVERAGFEPTKREARQIYSLLPLTTRPSLHGADPQAARAPSRSASVLEPRRGLEPLTYCLQNSCAANCATRARVKSTLQESNTKTIRRSGPRNKYGDSPPLRQGTALAPRQS